MARRFFPAVLLIAAATVLASVSVGCFLPVNQVEPSNDPAVRLEPGSLGSWDNPVKCSAEAGEIEYLNRLRGPDGKVPTFVRLGNVGTGVNGNIVDLFKVESQDGTVTKEVFMDMYFPGYVETEAVDGFYMADQVL